MFVTDLNPIVGIDLGTTHSLIATAEDGPIVIEGTTLVPSIVTYADDGQCHVGHEALAHPLASGLLASTKRFMPDPGQHIWQCKTPVDIASDILRYLKKHAEHYLKTKLYDCVMTVPAYFDEQARQATKLAAQMAGWTVKRTINEPTAAALAYGFDREGVYAVYDFGGGTFDLSIIRIKSGVFQVLATCGDLELGGDDIDTAIACHFKKMHVAHLAQEAKEALSTQAQWAKDGLSLTQEELATIAKPFIQRTLDLSRQALNDAQVAQVDGVILVGGSTRLWGLKDKVAGLFKAPICDHLNPAEVVVQGAAIQAAALRHNASHVLVDVIPLSLGLELMGGIVEKLIERNTPLPTYQEQVFTTYKDGQTAIRFHIVQGERELAKDCRSLSVFSIKNLPPRKAGHYRVKVRFTVDVNGLLIVTAKEEESHQSVEVQIDSALRQERVDALILESKKNAMRDMQERLAIEKGLR